MIQEGGVKIWRPRQVLCARVWGESSADVLPRAVKVYVGPTKQDYEPIDGRSRSGLPRAVATTVEHSG